MARPFSPATAEQVIAVVEAVVVKGATTDSTFVAQFTDLTNEQAEAALKLAADIGLLAENSGGFSTVSPLCRFVSATNQTQNAAVMRILLESYQPFVTFRQQLRSTTSASTAANQTKALLDLDEHRETIKDTLLNLGTYSQALVTEGGGHYKPGDQEFQNPLQSLALAGSDMAAAESLVINQVGPDALVFCARDEVLIPLADAVCRARSGDPDGAVLHAGNAVESYLVAVAGHFSVPLGGAPGINAKLDQLDHAGKLPKKLIFMGKYLGHIRNAADHGIDQDIINASWTISRGTGVEYPFVACSFIAAASSVALQKTPTI